METSFVSTGTLSNGVPLANEGAGLDGVLVAWFEGASPTSGATEAVHAARERVTTIEPIVAMRGSIREMVT